MPTRGLITVGAKVSKETHDRLEEIARSKGVGINQLIREMVYEYLEANASERKRTQSNASER